MAQPNSDDRIILLDKDCTRIKNTTANEYRDWLGILVGQVPPTVRYLGANAGMDTTYLNTVQYNGAGFVYFVDKNGVGVTVRTPPLHKPVIGVNGMAVAQTAIPFASLSGRIVPSKIQVIVKTVTGAGTPPIISIGTNAPDYDDVMDNYAINNSIADDLETVWLSDTKVFAAGTSLQLAVKTAATGFTAYTFDLILYFNFI